MTKKDQLNAVTTLESGDFSAVPSVMTGILNPAELAVSTPAQRKAHIEATILLEGAITEGCKVAIREAFDLELESEGVSVQVSPAIFKGAKRKNSEPFTATLDPTQADIMEGKSQGKTIVALAYQGNPEALEIMERCKPSKAVLAKVTSNAWTMIKRRYIADMVLLHWSEMTEGERVEAVGNTADDMQEQGGVNRETDGNPNEENPKPSKPKAAPAKKTPQEKAEANERKNRLNLLLAEGIKEYNIEGFEPDADSHPVALIAYAMHKLTYEPAGYNATDIVADVAQTFKHYVSKAVNMPAPGKVKSLDPDLT